MIDGKPGDPPELNVHGRRICKHVATSFFNAVEVVFALLVPRCWNNDVRHITLC